MTLPCTFGLRVLSNADSRPSRELLTSARIPDTRDSMGTGGRSLLQTCKTTQEIMPGPVNLSASNTLKSIIYWIYYVRLTQRQRIETEERTSAGEGDILVSHATETVSRTEGRILTTKGSEGVGNNHGLRVRH